MPSWASEMTSLTPRRPRRASLRRNSVQNGLGLGGADVHAEHLAPAVAVDADRDDDGDRDDAAALAHLQVGGVDPQIRPVALDRPVEEGLHLARRSPRTAGLTWLLEMPLMPMRLDQVVDRAGRDALDVGLLDHRGQRLLGHAARLQEAREVAALAQLGDAQLDRAGARLPVAVAVAVALGQPLRALLAIAGAGQAAHLQLHQPLGGKADHLAQQIGVGGLLHQRAQVHHLVGHRWFLESGWCRNPTLPANRR